MHFYSHAEFGAPPVWCRLAVLKSSSISESFALEHKCDDGDHPLKENAKEGKDDEIILWNEFFHILLKTAAFLRGVKNYSVRQKWDQYINTVKIQQAYNFWNYLFCILIKKSNILNNLELELQQDTNTIPFHFPVGYTMKKDVFCLEGWIRVFCLEGWIRSNEWEAWILSVLFELVHVPSFRGPL